MTVCDLKKGETATVVGLGVSPQLKERLRALCIYPNAKITLLKVSLFRTTYLVGVGFCKVAMRRCVAQEIRVVRK